MNITAEICVIPMGAGVSVSRYIAACQPILEKAGLNPVVHAYGTNVEGEWDDFGRLRVAVRLYTHGCLSLLHIGHGLATFIQACSE